MLKILQWPLNQFGSYVNSQSTWIRSDENPHTVHQIPLHVTKTGVWCAVGARTIIGQVFYHDTLNSNQYVELYWKYFSNSWVIMTDSLLSKRQCYCACCTKFNEGTERGVWWWDHLYRIVYRTHLTLLEALQNEIRNVVASISADELQCF
jgi:hypothetical protein